MAMAALNALAVPGLDDNMEISSPAGASRTFDDDTDILDFDDYQTTNVTGNQPADLNMLDDADAPPALQTEPSVDEVMDDEEEGGNMQRQDGLSVVEEHEMRDQHENDELDEELLDYGDDAGDEIGDYNFPTNAEHIETGMAVAGEHERSADIHETSVHVDGFDHIDDNLTTAHEDVEQHLAKPLESEAEQVAGGPKTQQQEHANQTTQNDDTADAQEKDGFANQQPNPEVSKAQVEASDDFDPNEEGANPEDKEAATQASRIGTSATVPADNGRGTPTDTGLHAMNLRYGDMSIPLFKSRRQPDGLLKSDNVANLSLAELMLQCRRKLAVKIGDDISDDQEIALSFDQLGLMVFEDSRPAFECSLNEVLEIYIQLHQNDHTTDIPPLSMSISLRLKFASSFATLKQAAAGGQGMSSFTAFSIGEIEDSEFEHDLYGVEGEPGGADGVEDAHDYNDEEAEHYDDPTYIEGHEDTTEFDDETLIAPNDEGTEALDQLEKLESEDAHNENDGLDEYSSDRSGVVAESTPATKHAGMQSQHKENNLQEFQHEHPLTAASDGQDLVSATTVSVYNSAAKPHSKPPQPADSAIGQNASDIGVNDKEKEEYDDFSSLTHDQHQENGSQEQERNDDYAAHAGSQSADVDQVNPQASDVSDGTTAQQRLSATKLPNKTPQQNEGDHAAENKPGILSDNAYEDDLVEENLDETDTFGDQIDDYHDDLGERDVDDNDGFGGQTGDYHERTSELDEDDQFHTAHDFSAELYHDEHNTQEHYEEWDSAQTHPEHATGVASGIEFPDDGDILDPNDVLDFDGDEPTEPNSTAQLDKIQHPASGSPGVKRSYDDHADDDDFAVDEPETKKTKAS